MPASAGYAFGTIHSLDTKPYEISGLICFTKTFMPLTDNVTAAPVWMV